MDDIRWNDDCIVRSMDVVVDWIGVRRPQEYKELFLEHWKEVDDTLGETPGLYFLGKELTFRGGSSIHSLCGTTIGWRPWHISRVPTTIFLSNDRNSCGIAHMTTRLQTLLGVVSLYLLPIHNLPFCNGLNQIATEISQPHHLFPSTPSHHPLLPVIAVASLLVNLLALPLPYDTAGTRNTTKIRRKSIW
jgi:hypothetical protein